MKADLLKLSLLVFVIGTCMVPIAAQGVTEGFVVHLTFFYPIHFLYNVQVTIRDQTGRVMATANSPDGSGILVPIRTETPIYWLTASAGGYASDPLTGYEANPAFWRIFGSSTIPVQTVGGDYWMTINFAPYWTASHEENLLDGPFRSCSLLFPRSRTNFYPVSIRILHIRQKPLAFFERRNGADPLSLEFRVFL